MPRPRTLALAALAIAMAAPPALAEDGLRDPAALGMDKASRELAQSGFELRAALLPGAPTFFTGGRGVTFISERVYLGGAGYGGIMTAGGAVVGGVGYGGFVAGWQTRLPGGLELGASCLIGGGGGGGAAGLPAGGSVALEPGLALGLGLGNGMRLGLTGGYLLMPMIAGMAAPTVGLRLEFKNFLLTWPIDD